MKILLPITSILIFSLSSCHVVEPFYIFNNTDGIILVESSSTTRSIDKGDTEKIRGLHHAGGSITFSNGTRNTYDDSLKGLLADWKLLRGEYICDGFWGAKFYVTVTSQQILELQPCSQDNEPIVLVPDNAS